MIGYAVLAIITLGAFIAVVLKFTQPINELRVVIQELKDCISNIKTNDVERDKRLNRHSEKLDNLDSRVGTLETKVTMYHRED